MLPVSGSAGGTGTGMAAGIGPDIGGTAAVDGVTGDTLAADGWPGADRATAGGRGLGAGAAACTPDGISKGEMALTTAAAAPCAEPGRLPIAAAAVTLPVLTTASAAITVRPRAARRGTPSTSCRCAGPVRCRGSTTGYRALLRASSRPATRETGIPSATHTSRTTPIVHPPLTRPSWPGTALQGEPHTGRRLPVIHSARSEPPSTGTIAPVT